MSRTYLRGDLYYADLGSGIGSEQKGNRPVVIIQNDVGNRHSPTVIIAAITSKANIKAKLPTHCYLDAGNRLAQPSLVLLEQIRTVDNKGLSGYYSDRPNFQRLLHDIDKRRIKAVACYKLDRISRKTSDLMRLLEYFERHNVTLLVCSNNINTKISTSKIIIQVLAIIAEFERDILTERIQDNLMELAKDGRWMGGVTPTGFSSKRISTGSGKNKSAVSFLVPIPEERRLVEKLFDTFLNPAPFVRQQLR